MSGIILPGKDKKPASEGRIEIAKGFSVPPRKEDQVAPAPEAPETGQPADVAQPAAEAPRARSARGGQPEFAFPPRGVQIRCPSCGTNYATPVFSIIDLGVNPELRGALLGGQVNVAVCPNCGTGGALGAPLLVHDPEHQFLGVYMPAQAGADDLQRQRVIGDLTQALMRRIPSEARKGYMLTAQQYVDWQRFMEKLWEFEGVTPEMLRKQRDQSALLQRLIGLADDDKALQLVLERSTGLIDRSFFALLDQILIMARSQGGGEELTRLQTLRQKLLDSTEAGQAVKAQQEKVRSYLERMTPTSTREQLVQVVVDAWRDEDGRQIVGTLAVATGAPLDYQFLMALSERIGESQTPEERKQLEELRAYLLEIQDQVRQQQQDSQAAATQQLQAVLQEVLQATDSEAALRENSELIDESFLALLAANIQQAERAKATGAVRRLQKIYEQALAIFQEQLPEDLQLLNQLLAAPDETTVRQLLKDNRGLLDREFLDAVSGLETEMRANGRVDIADRLKTLRGQIALML